MKYLLTLLLSFILLQSIYGQSYQFQRVLECENNDFEIIIEQKSKNTYDKEEIKSETYQKSITNQHQNIQRSTSLNNKIGTSEQFKDQKKIRCKKWVHSYKLKPLYQLRQQQQLQDESIRHIIDALPVQPVNNNRALQAGSEQPVEVDKSGSTTRSRSYGYSSASSTSNSNKNAQMFLSMYMNLNMEQNALIYQG